MKYLLDNEIVLSNKIKYCVLIAYQSIRSILDDFFGKIDVGDDRGARDGRVNIGKGRVEVETRTVVGTGTDIGTDTKTGIQGEVDVFGL